MADLVSIADGIAETIEQATGLRALGYVPEDVNPPMMFVVPPEVDRSTFARGQMELRLEVVVFTSRAVDRVGQQAILEYASFTGPKSVWKAVDDRKDLGLTGTDAAVLRFRPLGIEEVAAYGYFGGAFELLIITEGA